MKVLTILLVFLLGATCAGGVSAAEVKRLIKTEDIGIRDPFILPVVEEKTYYMYAGWGDSFQVYASKDLKEWEEPTKVFGTSPGFWATQTFWAPEVHRYKGKYYLFATFSAPNVLRACQILVSRSPRGPFIPLTDRPVTPFGWQCLDATLFVDDQHKPWIVFCREWEQVHDGEICAMPLTYDLKYSAGPPTVLFRASQAPWATAISEGNYVTDGCFMHKTKDGKLLMLWSSFGKGGYQEAVSRSESGKITGPWKHDPKPIYSQDGGHGMVFRTFEGKLMLVLHSPNGGPTRAKFIPVREQQGGGLVVE